MSVFDRFKKLERPRPEREEPPQPTPNSVAGRFGGPEIPPDPSEAAPVRCPKCGGENGAKTESCFNCGAELDTAEVRAHRIEEKARFSDQQRRAAALRESRKREAEAYAERELAKARAQQTLDQQAASGDGSGAWSGSVPFLWLMRAAGKIEDPWVRLGVQIALIGGLVGLVGYGISSPGRFGLLILVGILLGGGGYSRYGRWGRGRYRDWW